MRKSNLNFPFSRILYYSPQRRVVFGICVAVAYALFQNGIKIPISFKICFDEKKTEVALKILYEISLSINYKVTVLIDEGLMCRDIILFVRI